MSTETQGPENPQVKPIVTGDDFMPFSEPVNEKPYARPNINVSHEQTVNPIPAPVFNAAPLGGGDAYADVAGTGGGGNGGSTGSIPKSAPPPPLNPSMSGASDEEKKHGAKQLAKMIMDGYEFLHEIGNETLKFNERKIAKLQADGDIDLNVSIPYDMEHTVSAGDFIRDHNEIMNGKLKVSPQFKKDVMPVLERVLDKHGAGLTDEQYLAYAFTKDGAVKIFQIVMVRNQMKDMIDMLKEHTSVLRQNGHQAQGAPTTQQHRQQQQQQPAYQEPQPIYNAPPQQMQPVYQEPEEMSGEEFGAQTEPGKKKRRGKVDPVSYFGGKDKKRGGNKKADFSGTEEIEIEPGQSASSKESAILD
jgi:hypothetical protein